VLNALGVVALAAGAAALVLLPLVWVARRREFRRAVPKTA
jgi:hypothetical protein